MMYDVVGPDLIAEAEDLVKETFHVGEIAFPRDVLLTEDSMLLVSCDASEVAFGATVHVLSSSPAGRTCRLLISKTRIAPAKMSSIPRKELLGCLLGARLKNQVELALEKNLSMQGFYRLFGLLRLA